MRLTRTELEDLRQMFLNPFHWPRGWPGLTVKRRSWLGSSMTNTPSLHMRWQTRHIKWRRTGSWRTFLLKSVWVDMMRSRVKIRSTAFFWQSGQHQGPTKGFGLGMQRVRWTQTRTGFYPQEYLAMEQAGLRSFEASAKWRRLLFQSLMKTPPAGHRYVTVQQVLNADKEMWALSSQQTGGMLKSSAWRRCAFGQTYEGASWVACHFVLPHSVDDKQRWWSKAASKDWSTKEWPQAGSQTRSKAAERGQAERWDNSEELLKSLPTNCVSKLDNGKFICLHYNKYMQKAEVFVMQHGGSRVLFQSCHALSVATESYQRNLQCNCSQTILWQSWWRFALAAPFCRRRPNEKASRFCQLIILSTDSDRLQQFSS